MTMMCAEKGRGGAGIAVLQPQGVSKLSQWRMGSLKNNFPFLVADPSRLAALLRPITPRRSFYYVSVVMGTPRLAGRASRRPGKTAASWGYHCSPTWEFIFERARIVKKPVFCTTVVDPCDGHRQGNIQGEVEP
jgi:hypothetical protein